MMNDNPNHSHMLKPIQVNVQRCTEFRTDNRRCHARRLCTKTASGLGQPCAGSCGLGSSAYLCCVSPGASLGVSETEGLDKEMAVLQVWLVCLPGVLTGQPQAGTTLAPRGQGNKETLRVP